MQEESRTAAPLQFDELHTCEPIHCPVTKENRDYIGRLSEWVNYDITNKISSDETTQPVARIYMWTELNARETSGSSPLLRALLHLVILDCMQHDFVGVSGSITRMTF